MEDTVEAAILLRPHTPEDKNFILSSWGSSYFVNNFYNKVFSAEEFHERHRKLRDDIYQRPNTEVLIACAKTSPDLIVGYVITERINENTKVIHYLYVKEAFKDEKIATLLFKEISKDKSPIIITHMTMKASKILFNKRKQIGEFYYCPFMAI